MVRKLLKESKMRCVICKGGETSKGVTTVVLKRGGTTLVFSEVPAEICDNCGEEYITSDMNRELLTIANDAAKRGVTLEMLKYAA